ncbi:tetratricopeptide repeat protein [Aquimarina brevivitae]|uniref:Tetratricopeptide repeat protein n=1 Tax=Aquimarina brevivitae TaxID=323412 RepID=A0A4Q7PH45_9FLAO|nr:tetratricopeptide repeat protein [Aquimarina brevivitae]RZS99248.1 tetratricopeptide repeat protein [Aquimarina brevivitae]
MMKVSRCFRVIVLVTIFLSVSNTGYAQIKQLEPTWNQPVEDDLGNVSDEFQEYFFEALKQKAITNYERAIEALQRCIKIDPEPVILYLELGKNYLELERYPAAEENFGKVLEQRPDNKYVLELMFEVYFKQQKYSESVSVVEKLSTFDPMFKEQLANLYYLEERYDDAIRVLDELTEELGTDSYRQELRKRITLKLTNPNSQIQRLEDKIAENPKVEQNYLNLIYIYSQDDQKEKAFEVAKRLVDEKPDSELVHMALYKFYLDDNDIDKAMTSMNTTLKSGVIDEASKYKVIKDFLDYINANPQYEDKLTQVITLLQQDDSADKVFMELGNFYFAKDEKALALNFYERSLKGASTDYELLKRIVLLQIDLKRYEKARVGSELAIEIYPAQPIFYLAQGVALINLNKSQEGLDILLTGMDYIIEDEKMEADFYRQIGLAYKQLGDEPKATRYKEKASELENKS